MRRFSPPVDVLHLGDDRLVKETKMKKTKILAASMAITLGLNLASCGTILHPERKGQTSGHIDPAIAILDGIGLLFFIIPGAIAFAVDFSNGTIYLPGTSSSLPGGTNISSADRDTDVKVVKATMKIDESYLERLLEKETSIHADLSGARIIVQEIQSLDEVQGKIAYLGNSDKRLAHLKR
jgi:hypothetical protein